MSNALSRKDRIDAYAKLAEFWLTKWTSRRSFEWRVTLGLWLFLAIAALYVRPRPPEPILIATLILVVLGHTLFWIRLMCARNRRDRITAEYYSSCSEAVLIGRPMPERPKFSPKQNWIWLFTDGVAIFQIITTVFFAAFAYWFMDKLSLLKC